MELVESITPFEFTSGNSAVTPKAPHAAAGTINVAIVAPAKGLSDRGMVGEVQVNNVHPRPVMTNHRTSYLEK